jgi:hypothetical protein
VHAAERTTRDRAVLELQARARDHAIEERLERLERCLGHLHARIDGAIVTVVADAEQRSRPEGPASPRR